MICIVFQQSKKFRKKPQFHAKKYLKVASLGAGVRRPTLQDLPEQ